MRLRPVEMEDAGFIVWLRNLAHARGRVGDSALTVSGQEAWLKAYFDRAGDYYFIIETIGKIPIGAYGIYDVRGTSAESGRWVIRPDVPAALPSATLAFEAAFQQMGLTELRANTVSTNRTVLSLNKKFGFREVGITPAAQIIGGQPVDMVHFLLHKEAWPTILEKLWPLARVAEGQVVAWERSQQEAK